MNNKNSYAYQKQMDDELGRYTRTVPLDREYADMLAELNQMQLIPRSKRNTLLRHLVEEYIKSHN